MTGCRKMKVIIINGSPRNQGITATTLHLLEKELLDSGVKVDFVSLAEIEMAHCLGCCSCYRTGHCCIRDDAEKLSELIAEADGIILGSPTYASNVSGLMKDFIDRGHFVIEQLLHGKACVIVATGENYGNKDAAKVLKKLVIYSGGKLSGSIVFKVPFNIMANEKQVVDHGGKNSRIEYRDFRNDALNHINKKCRKAARKMIRDMQSGKAHPMQSLIHFIVLNIGIRSFVRKKGKLYQGVIDKWTKLGIYGSFHFSMRTTYEAAYGILDSLCCMGFKHVIMNASHADPQHQIAVEKGVWKS